MVLLAVASAKNCISAVVMKVLNHREIKQTIQSKGTIYTRLGLYKKGNGRKWGNRLIWLINVINPYYYAITKSQLQLLKTNQWIKNNIYNFLFWVDDSCQNRQSWRYLMKARSKTGHQKGNGMKLPNSV